MLNVKEILLDPILFLGITVPLCIVCIAAGFFLRKKIIESKISSAEEATQKIRARAVMQIPVMCLLSD